MNFADQLTALANREARNCRGDPHKTAKMLDSLSHVLGCTIADVSDGDRERIITFLSSAHTVSSDAAADMAPLVASERGVKP